jgi:hypothetical protein
MDAVARQQRVLALLASALDLDARERRSFLAQRCASDPSLRADVETILSAAGGASGFLEAPVMNLLRSLLRDDRAEDEPPTLSPAPLGGARFAPGEIFASRFRIVSLLGCGGMGEVYRADDLKLGQPVAIKLVTAEGARDEAFQRSVSEVRLARSIAHPNVCRVYDVGHAQGWAYLAMEYVDGETLASLLRRIGRLSPEKALDAGRQLCAGIAAAHEVGVLHRDLKPSNIMIDGRGRIRIMDFGLAVSAGDSRSLELAGTPAYMAPEQLTGDRVTARTDVYALGLVLFELFEGRPIFTATSLDERLHAGNAAAIAQRARSELDPAILAMICRCLDTDPEERPRSAVAVAAVLPGSNPLMVAVSDGQVPSPDMVAAARRKGSLSSTAGAVLLVGVIGGTVAVVAGTRSVLSSTVLKPPDVLVERARNVLVSLGYGEPPGDSEFWFEPGEQLRFVYRQSSNLLVPWNVSRVVTDVDPPVDVPGMATVVLDPGGRLIRLSAVPARDTSIGPAVDWDVLFAYAGLAPRDFVSIDPPDTLRAQHDSHVGWESKAVNPNDRLYVSAASLAGQPVLFTTIHGNDPQPSVKSEFLSERSAAADALLSAVILLIFVTGSALARRNLRLGRGDRRGAGRLAAFVACGTALSAVLRAHHVPVAMTEWTLLLSATGWALVWGALGWLMYLSLEPYARAHWPATLISWTRLVSGRVRDPLVGRDVLTGLAAGVVLRAMSVARFQQVNWATSGATYAPVLDCLRSGRHFAFVLVFYTLDALMSALGGLFVLLVIRVVLRKPWLAVSLWVALVAALFGFGTTLSPWTWAVAVAMASFSITVLLRLGLLSFAVMLLFSRLITRVPVTLDFREWYAGTSIAALSIVAALAIYGYLVAVAERPVPVAE